MKKPLKDLSHHGNAKESEPSLLKRFLRTIGTKKRHIGSTFTLARRNVSRSNYRSTLLILGITLTVALETGIVVSVDTLYDDFIFDNRNQNFTDIAIIPKKWTNLSILQSISQNVRSITGVAKASPVYTVNINRLIKNQLPEANILVYGIDPLNHPDFPTFNLDGGERKVTGNGVIISQTLLSESQLKIGDIIEVTDFDLDLAVDLKPKSFNIRGTVSDPSFFGNNIGYMFILMDIEALIDVVPETERSNILKTKIDVSIENLLEIKIMVERIKDQFGMDFFVWSGKNIPENQANGIRSYQTAMSLVVLASFAVEFLFITNILAISIRERSKEFGIFRAVGTSSRQLIAAITIELLIYSIIGSTLGLISGVSFALLLIWRMSSFHPSLSIQTLSIHANSLFATLSSGIIVSLISGLYPIFLVLTIPIIHNIHSRIRKEKSTKEFLTHWKYTITTGVLLTFTGLILQLFVGPSPFLDFRVLSIQFLTILLVFIGIIFIEIGVLVFQPKFTSKFFTRIFGIITTTISQRNIARESQKSRLTIISSALALTFIIVVGVVSAAIVEGVPLFFKEQWGDVDLIAEAPDNQLPDINLTASLDQRTLIVRSSFIQEERTEIQGVDSYLYGVDPTKYSYFAEDVIDSIYNYSYPSSLFLHRSDAIYGLISDFLYQKLFTPVGSNISVQISDNSTVNVTIGAVIKSNIFLGNGEYFYVSSFRFQEFFNSTSAKWFLCDLDEDVDSAQARIEAAFPQFQKIMRIEYFVEIIERSLVLQSSIFQILFFESFILAAIVQFVSILISTLHMEREIGIMRALGLSKKGIFNIFMLESIVIGVTALGFGVLNGLLCSILLSWYISLSIPIEVHFPLEQIIVWALFSFLITLGSTFLPSYRSSNKNINDTISGISTGRPSLKGPLYPQVFYPFWLNRTSKNCRSNFDIQENTSKAHEEIKKSLPSSSIPLWQFIKDHSIQFRVTFLIIMAVITFNYILVGFIIPQGLIPFDWLFRIYLSILPGKDLLENYLINFYFFINPYLFLVGLAVIGPIAYYFVHETIPTHLINLFLRGIIWGIIGCILCLIIPFLLLAGFIILVAPFSLLIISASPENPLFSLPIILSLLIFGIELYLFQRLWVFLVFEGISSGIPIDQKLLWMRSVSSEGRFKFIGLLVLHSMIQVLLTLLFQPFLEPLKYENPIPFLSPFSQLPVNPVIFLILASFEVIFFLILILYEVLQLQRQAYQFPPTIIIQRRRKTQMDQDLQDRSLESLFSSKK